MKLNKLPNNKWSGFSMYHQITDPLEQKSMKFIKLMLKLHDLNRNLKLFIPSFITNLLYTIFSKKSGARQTRPISRREENKSALY